MIRKVLTLGALAALTAAPAFAATRTSAIVSHSNGPIPYSQLTKMDSRGYNARSTRSRHARTTTAPAASPDAAAPAPTPDAAVPAPSNAAAPPSTDLGGSAPPAVNPPVSSTSTMPAPAVTTPPAANSSPQ